MSCSVPFAKLCSVLCSALAVPLRASARHNDEASEANEIEAHDIEAHDFNDEADEANDISIFLLWLLRRLQQASLDGDVDGLAS
jgi:hypothetical protein